MTDGEREVYRYMEGQHTPEVQAERQRIREWAGRPMHAAAHIWLQDPDDTSSKRFIALEPNGRYLADRRSKIIDAEVLPAFRLSHPVGATLEPGEMFRLYAARRGENTRAELRDRLEEGRQMVLALTQALAKYRPAELPLREWSDRQVIQQAMRWLEETGP